MKYARPKAVNVWHEGDLIKMEVVNKNDWATDRNIYATMVRKKEDPTHWYIEGMCCTCESEDSKDCGMIASAKQRERYERAYNEYMNENTNL